MTKIKIIAEAATNHFGNIDLAKKIIVSAAKAGCDFLKLQIIENEETYLPGKYKYGNYRIKEVRELRKSSLFSEKQLKQLSIFSKKNKIGLIATPFGFNSLKKLIKINPTIIKVASADINYKEFFQKLIKLNVKIIVSTGMCQISDIERVINFFNQNNYKDFVLMHCVSEYPHILERSQIGFIKTLKQYKCEIGFSDHTMDSYAATAAVSMGATWIEKHFTLSRELGGLDSNHSMEFSEMYNFCRTLKSLSKALNVKKRVFTKEEKSTRKRARRGIYFKLNIKKKSIIQKKDLLIVRPETNIDIWDLEKIVGKKIKRNVKKHTPLFIKDLI